MMVIPNILALFALTGTIKKVHDDYFNHYLPQHPDYKLKKKMEKEKRKSEQKKSA
jgi:AGCS family alanine or glycine:cation symporter